VRTDTNPPRYTRTPHLVGLVAEAERLATLVAGASRGDRDRVGDGLRQRAALATLRLDGSPIERPPALDGANPVPVAEVGEVAEVAASGHRGTWFDAMGVGGRADEAVLALEFLGATAALASDDLADRLLAAPQETLAELHRRLVQGLVDEAQAGSPRRSGQAVHDASVGRIIYFATDPADVPTRLALLSAWLQSAGAREHGLVVSGVLHLELLLIHPFESANGRLARAAARLALRARGLDPHGLAVPEVALGRAPIAYYEDVAATARRRDHTVWLERWGEAVAAGLREAAHALGVLAAEPAPRAATFLDRWGAAGFTIADYRATAEVGPEESRSDLDALLDAGLVRRVQGSRGLRFEVVAPR